MSSVFNVSADKFMACLWKSIAISGLVVYLFYILLSNNPCCQRSTLFTNLKQKRGSERIFSSRTNISHLVFGVAGSTQVWGRRRSYIESWWRPNITNGYLFLERTPTNFFPWPSSSPPFRIYEEITKFKEWNKHGMPHAIRMVRVILQTYRERNENVRWYVMADDDTVLFVDNLVDVLNNYDHEKCFYIGQHSESVGANLLNSFEMAFGGAGYALSYPLVEILAKNLDECIKRYPYLFGSDHILQSCLADLGVSLTHERGFHQIDIHGDISGFLSAHPQSPFLSLHHLDVVEPLFPSMNRSEAVNHLMKAAEVDQSRLLQQTVCYHKPQNWTFSISWGYSAHLYEKIHLTSVLQRPIETFVPWSKWTRPPHMFNTRPRSNDPCEAPHVFFFDSLEKDSENQIVTSYIRRLPRNLMACSSSGNHSADHVLRVRVLSPTNRLGGVGSRRECCDIAYVNGTNIAEVKLRACLKYEIVA